MADTQTKPREDDDVPLMVEDDQQQAQAETEAEDSADDAGDEYDIRDELDDHDRHVLDQLTEEELAALADDDEPEAPDGEEDAEETSADDEPKGDEPPADDDATAPADDAAPEDAPAIAVELTDEDRQRIRDAAKAARAEAKQKWLDGDLTDEELEAAFDVADDTAEQEREVILSEKRQQQQEAAFEQIQAAFHQEARKYLTIDYPELGNAQSHLPEFDRHVRAVTASPKYAGLTHRQMLEAAHRLYLAEGEVLGLDVPPIKGAAKSDAQNGQAEPKAKTKAKKPDVVPTLAKVPAAATNSAADGKWGSLQARFDAAKTADEMEAVMDSLKTEEEREAFASMMVGD